LVDPGFNKFAATIGVTHQGHCHAATDLPTPKSTFYSSEPMTLGTPFFYDGITDRKTASIFRSHDAYENNIPLNASNGAQVIRAASDESNNSASFGFGTPRLPNNKPRSICNICKRTFLRASDLHRHSYKHMLDGDVHECLISECDYKGSYRSDKLVSHIRNRHPELFTDQRQRTTLKRRLTGCDHTERANKLYWLKHHVIRDHPVEAAVLG